MAGNVFARSPLSLAIERSGIMGQPGPIPAAPAIEAKPLPPLGTAGAVPLPPPALMPLFTEAAKRYQVPVNLLFAIAQQESNYNPKAVGQATEWGTAKGMMQYLDSTAAGMGIDPFNPGQAVDAAARQLRERLDKGYTVADAVKEHFAGPDRKLWGAKTEAYGTEVLAKAGALGKEFAGAAAPPAAPPAAPGQPPADDMQRRSELQKTLDAKAPGRFKVLDPTEVHGIRRQAKAPPPATPALLRNLPGGEAAARDALKGQTIGQNVIELGKGVPVGATRLAGTVLKGLAALSQGAVRDQLELVKQIDAGTWTGTDADDPLGYTHMPAEMRAEVRAYLEQKAAQPVTQQPLYEAGQDVQDTANTMLPAAPGYEESIGRIAGEGLGTMGAGVLVSIAPVVGVPLAAATFTVAGSGEAVERAVAAGATEEQLIQAARLGAVPGLTDAVPIEILLGRIPIGGQFIRIATPLIGPTLRVAERIGFQAVIEGVQEGGQTFLQNAIEQNVYDPDQDLGEGVGPSAAAGGGVGGAAQVIKETIGAVLPRGTRGAGVGAAPQPAAPPPPAAQPVAPAPAPQPGPAAPPPGATAAAPPPQPRVGPLTKAVQTAVQSPAGAVMPVAPVGSRLRVQDEEGLDVTATVLETGPDALIVRTDEDGEVLALPHGDKRLTLTPLRPGEAAGTPAPTTPAEPGPPAQNAAPPAAVPVATDPVAAPMAPSPAPPATSVPDEATASTALDPSPTSPAVVPAPAAAQEPAPSLNPAAQDVAAAEPTPAPAVATVERKLNLGPKFGGVTVAFPDQPHADLFELGSTFFTSRTSGATSQGKVMELTKPRREAMAEQLGVPVDQVRQIATDYRSAVLTAARYGKGAGTIALPSFKGQQIDAAAAEAATSPTNDLPDPSDAQKEAGNYKKGHVSFQGLQVSIENPKGSTRSGKRPDGSTWSHVMTDHYGYIRRTEGADGEQVDVYLGPDPDAPVVYVIDQVDQGTGRFDEHKAMLGFASRAAAVEAYRSNFDNGWKVGPVTDQSLDQFKGWLAKGNLRAPLGQIEAAAPQQQGKPSNPKRRAPRAPAGEAPTLREAYAAGAARLAERFGMEKGLGEPNSYFVRRTEPSAAYVKVRSTPGGYIVTSHERKGSNGDPVAGPQIRTTSEEVAAAAIRDHAKRLNVPTAAAGAPVAEPIPAPTVSPSEAAKPQRAKATAAPEDMLQFLARKGGLRDDEGHDLVRSRHAQRFIPRRGALIRRAGLSIDEAGEALHEAGYFGVPDATERPTETQVLDLLDQALRGKVYPESARADLEQRQEESDQAERAEQLDRAEQDVRAALAEMGATMPDAEVLPVAVRVATGVDVLDALSEHWEAAVAQELPAAAAEAGEDLESIPGFEEETSGVDDAEAGGAVREEPEGGGEAPPAPVAARPEPDEGGSGAAPAFVEQTDQGDQLVASGLAAPVTTKDKVESQAQKPLRASKAQQGIDGLELFDPGSRDTTGRLFSFAGERARTMSQTVLAQAQWMDRRGKSPAEIYKKTRYFRGPDGKWRFEISDSDAKLKPFEGTAFVGALSDVLDHPKLYEAYPGLADQRVAVRLHAEAKPRGAYYRDGRGIFADGRTEDEVRSTLLHEVAHVIQDGEDFASGSNLLAGEIYDGENVAREQAKFDALIKQWEELDAAGKDAEADKLRPDIEAAHRAVVNAASFEYYRRTAGEVEARNVEKRDALRRSQPGAEQAVSAIPPWTTQDVAPDQVIIARSPDGEGFAAMSARDPSTLPSFSISPEGGALSLGEKVAARRFLDGEPVASSTGNDTPTGLGPADLVRWTAEQWKTLTGGKVHRADLGDIKLDRRAASQSVYHDYSRPKLQSVPLVPEVLRRGVIVQRGLGRTGTASEVPWFTIAAPVDIDGKTYVVAAAVRSDPQSQRLYLHKVYLKERLTAPSHHSGHFPTTGREPDTQAEDAGAFMTVLRDIFAVNEAMAEPSLTEVSLRDVLRLGPLGRWIDRLIRQGRVVLHDKAPQGVPAGAMAWTDTDGKIHLVAERLNGTNALAVLMHEAFHSGATGMLGLEAWRNLQTRLDALFRQFRDSKGEARKFFDLARRRVAAAKGETNAAITVEEFGAYAIEEYEQAPAAVKSWVQDLLGRVKAWLLRRFGVQLGRVTPAQLRALAVAALKADTIARGAVHGSLRFSLMDRAVLGDPDSMEGRRTIRQFVKGARDKIVEHGALPLIHLNYLPDLVQPGMTAAKEYMRVKREMDAYRNDKHARFDEHARTWMRWAQKNPQQNRNMAQLMHDSTLEGLDPSELYQSLVTAEDLELLAKSPRTDLADQVRARQAAEPARQARWAQLKARFDALPAEGQALYRDTRDIYKAESNELDEILLTNIGKQIMKRVGKAKKELRTEQSRIDREVTDPAEKADQLAAAQQKWRRAVVGADYRRSGRLWQLRRTFEANRVKGPYFPLFRSGDFFVTATNAEGEMVSFSLFEDSGRQDAFAKRLRREHPDLSVRTGKMDNKSELRGAIDPSFVADVEDALADAGVGDDVRDQIWQRYLHSLPEISLRRRFIHRSGVAGYMGDALRAFAKTMFHSAHQLAKLKYAQELGDLVDELREQAEQSADPTKAGTLVNEWRRRHEWVMNPMASRASQFVSSLAFAYNLAISPAAALVNLTQTAMLGVPILGQMGGTGRAAAALLKASKQLATSKALHVENNKHLTSAERDAMKAFYKLGLIDRTLAHDLAGVGETGVQYSPTRERVMRALSFFYHHAERVNREVTALAAYRLARQQGLGQEAAIEKAAELTWQVHFDYSNSNRPRYLQGDIGKILTVHRSHSLNMMYRLLRDARTMIKGETKEGRKIARRQLAGMMAMHGLFAGIKGLPFYGTAIIVAGLLKDLFGDPDDERSAEDVLKATLYDAMPRWAADTLLYGSASELTGLSLTQRIGLADFFVRSPDRELEGRDEATHWLKEALGPGVGTMLQALTGAIMMTEGEVQRGFEAAMPKALRDLLKAGRYASEGVLTMTGRPVVDGLSAWEMIAQAAGFTPFKVALAYEQRGAKLNLQDKILGQKTELMNRYALAIKMDDEDAQADVLAEMERFNEAHPEVGLTAQQVRDGVRSRQRSDDRATQGVVLDERLRGYLEEQLGF